MARLDRKVRAPKFQAGLLSNTEQLWRYRVNEFWSEVIPYLGYVIQSGLGFVLAFAFIGGTALYASFLDHIPPGFPVRELGWILLSPSVAYMTYRTFLQSADLGYLLRIEHRMNGYIKRSIRYSLTPRLSLLLVLCLVYWPLYSRADQAPKPLLLLLLAFALMKLVTAYGAWGERHMHDSRLKLIARLIRYIWSWGAVACWLWLDIGTAGLVTGVSGLLYMAVVWKMPKLRFPWEEHNALEQVHRNRIFTFLSGFVDLPTMNERRFSRPWLNGLGNRYAFQKPYAYRYLLTKTFVRSELLGILVRLMVIGVILLWWTKHSVWSALLLLFFLLAIHAQSKAILQLHRHDVWLKLYPVTREERSSAVLALTRQVLGISVVLLMLPLWWGSTDLRFKGSVLLGAVLAGLFFYWRRKSTLQRIALNEEEEE
ncbi:ABC transporter permease [Paenibacillus sp. 1001270B_150601_E10]|uniref:ABC transporter permease n=1 Tax=Paenibacillus sp. 1001270B_150601_E10 TaxID=2787079 RepID=UPI00189ED96E|nr:ABC transporter permease [Paenibacillus sp. 1001270B_150601_E10]